MSTKLRVDYVVPQPRWTIYEEGKQRVEFSEAQTLQIVNKFLSQFRLGEVSEDWTPVGRTYLYKSQFEKAKEGKEK